MRSGTFHAHSPGMTAQSSDFELSWEHSPSSKLALEHQEPDPEAQSCNDRGAASPGTPSKTLMAPAGSLRHRPRDPIHSPREGGMGWSHSRPGRCRLEPDPALQDSCSAQPALLPQHQDFYSQRRTPRSPGTHNCSFDT